MQAASDRKQTKAERTLEKILDAAIECYTLSSIDGTSLDDVARTAGIGRTTLYRYVSNRDDLLAKVLVRDAQLQQEELMVLMRSHDDLATWLVDSMVHVMRARRTRPMNALLFGGEEGSTPGSINVSPANFYGIATELLGPLFERARAAGQIREGVTLEKAVHWVARVQLSLINYPEQFLNDEDALREFLREFLVPSLVVDNP